MFCIKCGKEIANEAQFCQFCGQQVGASVKVENNPKREPKSQFIALLLCSFLGFIGIHDFYLERNGCAIAKLLIAILFGWLAGIGLIINGIWCLIDFITILFKGYDVLLTDEEIEQREKDYHYYSKVKEEREDDRI